MAKNCRRQSYRVPATSCEKLPKWEEMNIQAHAAFKVGDVVNFDYKGTVLAGTISALATSSFPLTHVIIQSKTKKETNDSYQVPAMQVQKPIGKTNGTSTTTIKTVADDDGSKTPPIPTKEELETAAVAIPACLADPSTRLVVKWVDGTKQTVTRATWADTMRLAPGPFHLCNEDGSLVDEPPCLSLSSSSSSSSSATCKTSVKAKAKTTPAQRKKKPLVAGQASRADLAPEVSADDISGGFNYSKRVF